MSAASRWVLLALFAALLSLNVRPAAGAGPADSVRVDMSKWYRRDWNKCKSPTRLRYTDGNVRISSDRSAALFWQIPTLQGEPVNIDVKENAWLKQCKRPPRNFDSHLQQEGMQNFIDASKFRYVTWRWKLNESTIPKQVVESDGELNKKYDDFAAKIGITIQKKGSNDIREVAYVWSSTLPKSLMFKSETTVIPFIWKLVWSRFVVETGNKNAGRWISETRDLYADYQKSYPGEVPGKILRVYLMTDSDNTKSRASASYADIVFHPEPPAPDSTGVR